MTYRRTETREGPPLTFVAEKLRSSLVRIHRTRSYVVGRDEDSLTHAAFADGLKAYLALWDVLGEWSPDLVDELLRRDSARLEAWLDEAEGRGGVLGGRH